MRSDDRVPRSRRLSRNRSRSHWDPRGDLARVAGLSLADSAFHAPSAGFGDVDLSPDFVDKAAVLLVRLVKNHPLPDGNKRAGWVAMRLLIAINGWTWRAQPDIDDAERVVFGIAAGEVNEEESDRCMAAFVPRCSRVNRVDVRPIGALARWLNTRGVPPINCSSASAAVHPGSVRVPRSHRL